LSITFSTCFAQKITSIDVITLKDSTILKGEIIENIVNDYISLRTTEGQMKVIKYPDIVKISKGMPDINLDDYGGMLSCGVAVGGGGLVGVPVRYYIKPTLPVEFGVHLRPVVVINDYYDISDLTWNVLFAGTFDFYFNKRLNKYKERVQMSGMFVKAGYHTGKTFKGTLLALGWAYERFKTHQKNKSVTFELGVGVDFLVDKEMKEWYDTYNNSYYGYNYEKDEYRTISPMIYWKVGWNFFVKE